MRYFNMFHASLVELVLFLGVAPMVLRRYDIMTLLSRRTYVSRHAGLGRGVRKNKYTRHDGTDGSVSLKQTLINIRSVRLPRGKDMLPVHPGSSYHLQLLTNGGLPV